MSIADDDHVHLGHLGGASDFASVDRLLLQNIDVLFRVLDFGFDVTKRLDQKASCPAGWVIHRIAEDWID